MANDEETVVEDEQEKAPEVDYSTMTTDQLLEEIGKAYADKNMKLMGQLSKLYTKAEGDATKKAKDALLEALTETTTMVRKEINGLIDKLVSAGKLEGAEGVWFSRDFGEIEEVGINPACKLVKSTRRSTTGASAGTSQSSSYVAHPAKSSDLLAQVGSHIMFAEATEVKIDKVSQTVPAGMTFKEAYEHSTNGGWRNRVRMALLKEAGLIGTTS